MESITFQDACGVSSVLIILAKRIAKKAGTPFQIIIAILVDIKATEILTAQCENITQRI